jgi:hypothetical protein
MSEIFEPIEDKFEPLNKEELSSIEGLLEAPLPDDYAKFQMNYGRCIFIGEALIRTVDGREIEVFSMFGAKGDVGNFLVDLELHPEYLEGKLIPIADDMFNNRYVLNYISGEISFIEYSNGVGSLLSVASSFTEFLKNIEVIPDD